MKINVIRSAIIDAPIDRVWTILRDFNSHHRWHPAVDASQMENNLDGDVVGGVRRFSLSDGAELREQLLRHDDRDHTFTYCILDSPLPLFDYVSTVSLKPVTDGNQTFWDWRAQFRAPADRAEELERLVGQQIYEAGFSGLRMFLAEPAVSARPPASDLETEQAAVSMDESLQATAVEVTKSGGPEVMALRQVSVDAPGPRQVRIRQRAAAVNRIDIAHRQAAAAGFDLPGTPGLEGVGEIINVGPQVDGLFPGDRVAYLSRTPGAYTDIRCVDADACIPLALDVSDEEASLLLKGVTAVVVFDRILRAVAGATVMIQAVSGGLGYLLGGYR